MRKISYWPAAVAVALLATVAGCGGGYEGDQRAEVTGKVTYDGEPVSQGALNLIPLGHAGNKVSVAIVDGAYTVPEGRGPNFGKYRVEVYYFKPAGVTRVGAPLDDDLASATHQVVPPKFNSQSTLELEVGAKKVVQDFVLRSS